MEGLKERVARLENELEAAKVACEWEKEPGKAFYGYGFVIATHPETGLPVVCGSEDFFTHNGKLTMKPVKTIDTDRLCIIDFDESKAFEVEAKNLFMGKFIRSWEESHYEP